MISYSATCIFISRHLLSSCSLSELSSILFLEISLTMLPLQLQPYHFLCLILKHYRAETGTISQRSEKSGVHLRMCSDPVSTFCCSRVYINHSFAEHRGTCYTLSQASRPLRLRSVHLLRVGIAYSSFVTHTIFCHLGFCTIAITQHRPLHMIVLYQPRGPPDIDVRVWQPFTWIA